MLKIGFPSTKQNNGPKVFLNRLKKSIKKQNLATITHFLNPFHQIGLYNSVARNIFNKPYIVRIDGIYFDKKETLGNNDLKNKPIFDSIKNASGIIFQSQFSKNLIESFFGKIQSDYTIISNGASIISNNESYRKELNIDKNDRVIICSAHWRAHKRLKYVIEVFKILKSEIKNLALIILGKNAEIEALPGINYTGEVETNQLSKYYKSADLLLELSWLDNCPNTVVEAIACGLPVVCSNQGGTKELVEKTSAGIVSQCDEDIILGELLDLYNPPSPDILQVVNDVKTVFENYKYYSSNIKTDKINIDIVAQEYIQFIRNISKK